MTRWEGVCRSLWSVHWRIGRSFLCLLDSPPLSIATPASSLSLRLQLPEETSRSGVGLAPGIEGQVFSKGVSEMVESPMSSDTFPGRAPGSGVSAVRLWLLSRSLDDFP